MSSILECSSQLINLGEALKFLKNLRLTKNGIQNVGAPLNATPPPKTIATFSFLKALKKAIWSGFRDLKKIS